jgi:hypothetical protein
MSGKTSQRPLADQRRQYKVSTLTPAGAMQILSCEGAQLSRAETVLQGTIHDTVRAEIG